MTDLEKELVEKIGAVARAAVELAIIRSNLRPEGEVYFDEATTAKIAEDAWNACQGIDCCYEEPCNELKALCSYTQALVAAAVGECALWLAKQAQEINASDPVSNILCKMFCELSSEMKNSLTPADAARELERIKREARLPYKQIFKWLLGENGEFKARPEGAGAYWWRAELRQRIAALSGKESSHD